MAERRETSFDELQRNISPAIREFSINVNIFHGFKKKTVIKRRGEDE